MMPCIEGYTGRDSVVPGETLSFHVSTDAPQYQITITREDSSAALIHRVEGIPGSEHPIPPLAYATGCGWPESYRLEIPGDWPSGVYRARLTASLPHGKFTRWCNQTGDQSLLFSVRAARPGAAGPILLQLCTNTYNAYNFWGGHSLYEYNSMEERRSDRVSFNRPGNGIYGHSTFGHWERKFVDWANAKGIPLEFGCNYDLEAHPELLARYRLILSVGHDEYWSGPMRENMERYIEDGGNFAIFSGNSVCWQVRYEDDGRTMRCHKEVAETDPAYARGDHRGLTAAFSDPEVGWPENAFTGLGWNQGGYHRSHGQHMDGSGAYTVRRADHWVFEGTGLKNGDEFGGADTIVGYETDGCLYEERDGLPYPTGVDGTPRDLEILCQAPASTETGHDGRATMGIYRRGKGTVFNAGTTDWAHGLDDPVVDRITRNVLYRLAGLQRP